MMMILAVFLEACKYLMATIVMIITYKCISRCTTTRRRHTRMPISGKRVDNTRDGFSVKKIPDTVDVIVIGSGMGSMMCAGWLSRIGKRVLVLEQHYIAGGCTHCFEDGGYDFDTGLHYVGDAQRFTAMLDLVTSTPIEFQQLGLDEDGTFDRFLIGRDPTKATMHRMRAHHVIDDLIAAFPHEEQAIRTWSRYCHRVMNTMAGVLIWKVLPRWLSRICTVLLRPYLAWASVSAWDMVCKLTDNPLLRVILLGNFGDIGQSPTHTTFMMQAGVFSHYMEGAYYPRDGPQQFARSIIETIEANSGRVLVRAPVDEIIVDASSNSVTGVRVKGMVINCSTVVSGAGVYNTFNQLLPSYKHQNPTISKLLRSEGPSAVHCYAFIGLHATSAELKLPSSNLWVLPCDTSTYDVLDDINRIQADPLSDESPPWYVFIGFPSAKDPNFQHRFPGKSTAVVLTELSYDLFKQYDDDTRRQGARGDDYERVKNAIGAKLLNVFRAQYPHLSDHIEFVEYATPLSTKFYLNTPFGESYGLGHSIRRHTDVEFMEFMRAGTDINGLYLTGQDTLSSGVFPAALSGLVTGFVVGGIGGLSSSWLLIKAFVKMAPASCRAFFRAYL